MKLIIATCPSCVRGVDPYAKPNKGGECAKCNGLGLQLTEEGKEFQLLITAIVRRHNRISTLTLSKAIHDHFEKTRQQHQREP